jgi:hypothetical protein
MTPENVSTIETPTETPTETPRENAPARPRTVVLSQPAAETAPPALARLMKVADGYFVSGAVRQATELYFQILEKHADTPQAARARERLMAIAERYEKANERRQARSLYERLL